MTSSTLFFQVLFVLFTAATCEVPAENAVLSDIVAARFLGPTSDDTPELNCPVGLTTPMSCLDCFTMAFCDGKGNAVYNKCPTANPYCNNNLCSTERDLNSDICNEQIIDQERSCTSEGYFPDPLDCQTFYFCPDPNIQPPVSRFTYTCPANYVYDSATFECRKQTSTKDCPTMTCTQVNTFLLYPGNPNYFGFCKSILEARPVVFKCPEGHEFNLQTYGCDFPCTKEGFFAGQTCRQHYYCYKSGTKYVKLEYFCPETYAWDQVDEVCKPEASVMCSNN